MVLGLIWFFISYVSCWGNLGVIFLRERETLALSSMATPQSGCYWWIGNIQESHFLKRSKSLAEKTKSLGWFLRTLDSHLISSFLLHILDLVLFLLCFIDFLGCFWKFSFQASCQWKTFVLVGLVVLLKYWSGVGPALQIDEEEKLSRVSLSMKDLWCR